MVGNVINIETKACYRMTSVQVFNIHIEVHSNRGNMFVIKVYNLHACHIIAAVK